LGLVKPGGNVRSEQSIPWTGGDVQEGKKKPTVSPTDNADRGGEKTVLKGNTSEGNFRTGVSPRPLGAQEKNKLLVCRNEEKKIRYGPSLEPRKGSL